MVILPGFAKEEEIKVCHLLKSLYGLKQASRQWFQKLTTALLSLGYKQSKTGYSLFTKVQGSSVSTLLVYLDDIIIASNNMSCVDKVKSYFHDQFQIKDLSQLKYLLGL